MNDTLSLYKYEDFDEHEARQICSVVLNSPEPKKSTDVF